MPTRQRTILLILALIWFGDLRAQDYRSSFHQRLAAIQEIINKTPRNGSPPELVSSQNGSARFNSTQGIKFDMQIDAQEDWIIGMDDPYEEVTINGEYSHNGDIIILNQGTLNLLDADFTLRGNIVVTDSGQFNIRGGNLTVLAEYIYQYHMFGFDNSVITFDSTEFSSNSRNWYAQFEGNSHFLINDTHFSNGISAYLLQNSEAEVVRANRIEWLIVDNASLNISNSDIQLIWPMFPNSSQASLSFPDGDFVTDFTISADGDSINGIGWFFHIDSTTDVSWAPMLQEGSNVTIRDSYLRAIGILAVQGDSLAISGLVSDQYYGDFTAPISDRDLRLINTTLETWNVYPEVQNFSMDNCIIGEFGFNGGMNEIEYSMVDGSGGYIRSGHNSSTIFMFSSVFSHIVSEQNSMQLYVFSAAMFGDIIATNGSMIAFIHSITEYIPVARDTAVVVEMAIIPPENPAINSLLPVIGTAVFSSGPFVPFDLDGYRLSYGIGNEPEDWIPIGSMHPNEVRNDTLDIWDTQDLQPGEYTLKLTLYLSIGDSLEAVRGVYLGEYPLSVDENQDLDKPTRISLAQNYPNPFNPITAIQYQLSKGGRVTLVVYNLLGQEVVTLVNKNQVAGRYSVTWDGKDNFREKVTGGIYFYQIRTKDFVQTKKLLFLK